MIAGRICEGPGTTLESERLDQPRSTTILVVDDSIVVRSILRTALISRKYDVVSARDANEALMALDADDTLDLIITDFHMPGLDGAAFIEVV